MGNDDLGEEMAARQADRYGNQPLRRGPDPDRVAAHLATGETMTTAKAPDDFTTESPIRAFTRFQIDGTYAIGKGFRPSLAHLGRYLDAMERKEGWRMVQIILPDDPATDPTVLFRQDNTTILNRIEQRVFDTIADGHAITPWLESVEDDPINPKHYNGTACAEIGELLTPNGYQVLKYVWRLGEKDAREIEIGKAIWYLKREIALGRREQPRADNPPITFLDTRLSGQGELTGRTAITLWRHTYCEEFNPLHVLLNRLERELLA